MVTWGLPCTETGEGRGLHRGREGRDTAEVLVMPSVVEGLLSHFSLDDMTACSPSHRAFIQG